MSSGTFNTVSMIDAAFASLLVYIKIPEVIVEVHRAGAKVATQERGVSCEDGSDVDMTLSAERNSNTSEPFVKVGDDGGLGLMCSILWCKKGGISPVFKCLGPFVTPTRVINADSPTTAC
jgi:hypothetical protein